MITSFSRVAGALVALLGVGSVMLYSVSHEKPVGRVHGRAILDESGKPLARVHVTLVSADEDESPDSDGSEQGVRRLRATTDKNGEFELARVPVGSYHLSAATRAHSVDERSVLVSEDETSDVPFRLKKSQPDLQASLQQRQFLPTETVMLPLHGYVDGAKPAGTDALRVRIYRARYADILSDSGAMEAFGKVADSYNPSTILPVALLHPKNSRAPQLLETRTVALKNADIEGFYHERLKLGAPGAGLYLVEVQHGKNSVCAQLSVSDLALVVKKTPGQLLAYTVDSGTGAPRANASIRVLQGGKVLTSARTDKEGLAHIQLPKSKSSQSGGKLLSLASFGQNEATVGQYGEGGDEDENHGGFTVHAYTDRPIYRPGGRVSWKGIARRTLDSGLRYSVPVGEAVDFEVRDPEGERIASSKTKTNAYGSFSGSFELSGEAPSGSYSMVMTLNGEEHTEDFSVASYRKPEFAATVTPNEKHYSFGDSVEMMVSSAYYFGAPVAGAKAHYSVTRAPDWAALYADDSDDNSDGYEGEGAYADDSGETVSEGDVTLDANGHAVIRFEAKSASDTSSDSGDKTGEDIFSEEPQDQIYSVSLSVKDPAGREVEASGQVPVSSGDFRLQTRTEGYFASPHQATTVSVAARDFGGKPLANLPVELQTSYRKWDTELDKWQDGATQTLRGTTGTDGVAKIPVTPSSEGVLTLSAQAQDSQKRPIVATRTLWISGSGGGDFDAQYGNLSLLTDKKRYTNGENARVLLNAEQSGGTALVSVEGSKLFRAWLVRLDHKSTAFEVPMLSDYGPNVTLAACTVRGKKFASSEAPLRVEVPKRDIRVAVQADRAKYAPGDKITYTVQTTDYQGKPTAANLSFGVVDEAIYALQGDDPRALKTAFYPQHPNSVQTSYSFEPLYLGDVNKAEPNIEARTKFLDTAFWQSDVETDTNGRASVSFRLPDNLTTWRATALAQTLDSSFGRREQKVVVAKDFFVRLETPRFFTGGDHGQIMALVHNETGQKQDANVKIEAQGLTLSGDESRLVSIEPGGVAQVVWPVQTDAAGLSFANMAHFKLSAWTSPQTGARLSDALETQVPVRAHGREDIQNFVGHLDSGGTWSQKFSPDAKAISSASRMTVRVTPSVSDALVSGLNSLIGFPYGCTEQTMSRFLPDILVQRTLRLRGLQDASSQKMKARLPKMVRDGVTRLARFQHESGGWGWWEHDEDDPWMTAYVLYGLAQARAEGYEVPDAMLSKGRGAAIKMLAPPAKPLSPWQLPNFRNTRSFVLYSLALASPSTEESAKILATRKSLQTELLDAQALSYLVLLDKQIKLPSESWSLLESKMHHEGDALYFWKGSGYEEWADWDDQTATAMGLRAMLAAHPDDERVAGVLLWMMTQRHDDQWSSTRDTAWTLGALCDYLDANKTVSSTVPGTLRVLLNGTVLQTQSLKPQTSNGEFVVRVPWQNLKASGNTLSVERSGSGEPVFCSVQMRQTIGDDKPLPALTSSIPISVTREYRRLLPRATGQNSWTLTTEATNNRLKQGDQIRVRLTFNVPRDLSYVLIEDAFPSGCETTERGDAGEGNEDWNNWWSSTDVRDDRIAFFARHMTRGKHVVEYNLRAQTPGTFNAMPTLLQAMYDPQVRAESGETSVSVE